MRHTIISQARVSALSNILNSSADSPLAPRATRTFPDSPVISPTNGAPLSLQLSHEQEEKIHKEFDHGGIKLKKRPSTNFGAPFGSLGGYGSVRGMS